MRDAINIQKIDFTYDGEIIIPIQTMISDHGDVYIKFRRENGSTINFRSTEIKNLLDPHHRNLYGQNSHDNQPCMLQSQLDQ